MTKKLAEDGAEVRVCHNRILVETSAVLGRRFELDASRALERDVVRAPKVIWVTRDVRQAAVGAQLAAGRRGLGLVDEFGYDLVGG